MSLSTAAESKNTKLRGALHVLPIVERWDCHACGICCKAHTVFLDEDDVKRLESQQWDRHPDFAGTTVVRRVGLFGRDRVLAQKPDGSCVFLTDDGLCSIHKEHGEPAKPWACRMFPFQVLPTSGGYQLTMRRNCPSAAANNGRPLREHLAYARSLGGKAIPQRSVAPPRIVAGAAKWDDSQRVAQALQEFMLEQSPLPLRFCRGLHLCERLAECKPDALKGVPLRELLPLLVDHARHEVDERFGQPPASPSSMAAVIFRQAAAEYMRFHPNMGDRPTLAARARLFWAALRIVRGKGALPRIHPDLPEARFDQLEAPLGEVAPEAMQPIEDYFEAMAASTQYCGAGRAGWSIVDGFRALALAYAAAMWALRWVSAGRSPAAQDGIDVVCLIDRSHYYPLLSGFRHKKRLQTLTKLGELDVLLRWYGR